MVGETPRRRPRSDSSEAALLEQYLTPDGETPNTRRRCVTNRRQAVRRFRQRQAEINSAANSTVIETAEESTVPAGPLANEPIPIQTSVRLRARRSQRGCALATIDDFEEPGRHQLPPRNEVCERCHALKWPGETKGSCCRDGAIDLPLPLHPPEIIKELYRQESFLRKIRSYNMVFAFTSLGAEVNENIHVDTDLANQTGGVYTFRVQGAVCHRIGTLHSAEGLPPAFAQLYFFDGDLADQVQLRMEAMTGLDRHTVRLLEATLQELNVLASTFKTAKQRWDEQGCPRNFGIRLLHAPGTDMRRYNQPTASEVAALMIDGGPEARSRDIIVHLNSPEGGFQEIFESHPLYDPLQYPLIYLRGELGWGLNATYQPGVVRNGNNKISCAEFVAYWLYFKREGESEDGYSLLHRAGRLLQQWCVDQAAKIIEQRLLYHRLNQAQMRGALLAGITDMAGEADLSRIGTHIILSPSFTGGERYMRKLYHDAMAIVRAKGKPDLFITITCNPEWSEITANLLPGQKPQDRPDIVARVFRLKLKAIVSDIKDRHIFGDVLAQLFVIEFQKRGLPHAHMLIILRDGFKPITANDYDKIVCAEIPDPTRHPSLYATVTRCMMHGPCGHAKRNAVCMKDKVCSKKYPKDWSSYTRADRDGYPTYRRRNNGRITSRGNTIHQDNRWVVPYNPYLSAKYDCHINVEICSTISSVKYLYKYVYKGQDRSSVSIGGNEIQQYLDARYLSAPEACWRIFKYPLQEKSHNVVQLPVHLNGLQYVTFRENDQAEDVIENSTHTKLTRFFQLCATDPFAKGLLFHEVTTHYVWKAGRWVLRQRGGEKAVGRLVAVPPSDAERFYMRLMLCYVRGPESFDALKTVDGVIYTRYKDAALAAGLLDTDEECNLCLQEATLFKMPSQLRRLFATILAYCHPADARSLRDTHLHAMAEDFMHAHQVDTPTSVVVFQVLKSVNRCLQSNSLHISDFQDLPQLEDYAQFGAEAPTRDNRLIRMETSYDPELLAEALRNSDAMTDEQRCVYEDVLQAVQDPQASDRLFFVDGPGGTGKSFLLETILAKVRIGGDIAIAVASSGIAAQLLTGGRTAHSRFKIKLKLNEKSTCSIAVNSDLAELIRRCKLIVWDEAPMMHRHAIESVERTLQHILDDRRPFGGKVVLFAGDFRQILPVIPRAGDATIIAASIKKSPLWRFVHTHKLTSNMRLRTSSGADAEEIRAFSEFLLQIGDGRHDTHPSLDSEQAYIPRDLLIPAVDDAMGDLIDMFGLNIRRVVDFLYSDIASPPEDAFNYLSTRAILSPLNADVEAINNEVMRRLPGDLKEYLSIDSVECEQEMHRELYPAEFLNTISLSGLPSHRLRLKEDATILLMRNLDADQGLCNGTRLLIQRLTPNCIEGLIMNGISKGQSALIPRITLISKQDGFPFQIRRKQFPVQVAFAMTVNKAQGQSIPRLAVYLPQPVFSHGQLYVALSRATSRSSIKVLIQDPEEPDGPN